MGKIIADGFAFMERVNSHLIRKIDDISELKHELITLSGQKTHKELSEYALALGERILDISGMERTETVERCYEAVRLWQQGQAHFQVARSIAGEFNDMARTEANPVKVKALRAFGQIAATPHVRWHALGASEYAVVTVNLLYPNDMEKVRAERELQIELMKNADASI